MLKAKPKGQSVRSETINSNNVADIEWDGEYFKFCSFEGLSIDGQVVTSDFVGCSFKNIAWYWGLFSHSNFIKCKFANCAFAGTAFPDCRFVDCNLVDCRFIKDDLGCDCDFSKTIAYGCSIESSLGFGPFPNTVI
jgi:uncharacterized protein YjbI with pentapeptide repeats